MPIPIGCVDKKYKEIMQPQSALPEKEREKRKREREREREKKIGHMNMG
jgi:hypothetical protein